MHEPKRERIITEEERAKIKTWEDWERDVLESADEDGVVQAWETSPWIDGLSRLFHMQVRGLIDRRDGRKGGPWVITDRGRAAILPLTTGAAHE